MHQNNNYDECRRIVAEREKNPLDMEKQQAVDRDPRLNLVNMAAVKLPQAACERPASMIEVSPNRTLLKTEQTDKPPLYALRMCDIFLRKVKIEKATDLHENNVPQPEGRLAPRGCKSVEVCVKA